MHCVYTLQQRKFSPFNEVVQSLFTLTSLSSVPALFFQTRSECFLVNTFEKCFNRYVIYVHNNGLFPFRQQ